MGNFVDDKSYTKTDQSFLKNYNINKILGILRKYKLLSRIELSAISSLDKKTITNITKKLLEKKQIEVVEHRYEGMGRPKAMLGLRGDYCKCLGLDLGGPYITGAIIDFKGDVICSHLLELYGDFESEELLEKGFSVVDELLKQADFTIDEIDSIGISIPGLIDKDTGMPILSENIPKWSLIPLEKSFKRKFNKDIIVGSYRQMAVAELWYGKGQNRDDFIVFELGLGIGCGIVIDKHIYAGASGKSGEVGHTIVEVDGPPCTCGRQGCIEALASGWALVKQASEAIENGVKTKITEVKGDRAMVRTADIRRAAQLGDEFSISLLKDAGKYIGIGIANVIDLFNPSMVILNGRLVEDNAILVDAIKETVAEHTIPQIYNDTEITESEIGVMATAIGAATMCLEKIINNE